MLDVYEKLRLWLDCAYAQANLSLHARRCDEYATTCFNVHVEVSREVSDRLLLLPYVVYARSEGSDLTARTRRLI